MFMTSPTTPRNQARSRPRADNHSSTLSDIARRLGSLRTSFGWLMQVPSIAFSRFRESLKGVFGLLRCLRSRFRRGVVILIEPLSLPLAFYLSFPLSISCFLFCLVSLVIILHFWPYSEDLIASHLKSAYVLVSTCLSFWFVFFDFGEACLFFFLSTIIIGPDGAFSVWYLLCWIGIGTGMGIRPFLSCICIKHDCFFVACGGILYTILHFGSFA